MKNQNNYKHITDNEIYARFLCFFIRNSDIENLHVGKFPKSKVGDFSDVEVHTPYGVIPWNKISRISEEEMRQLMLNFEKQITLALTSLNTLKKNFNKDDLIKFLEKEYVINGVSWDMPSLTDGEITPRDS